MSKGWDLLHYPDDHVFEIIPVNDLRKHWLGNSSCWCKPDFKFDAQLACFNLTHHAKDKREIVERGEHLKLVVDNDAEPQP